MLLRIVLHLPVAQQIEWGASGEAAFAVFSGAIDETIAGGVIGATSDLASGGSL